MRSLVQLTRLNLQNSDFDCIYPLAIELSKDWELEERLWFCIYYMMFYNESSALVHFHHPNRLEDLPVDTARRCLRGGKVRDHLDSWTSLVQPYGDIHTYLTADFGDCPQANWTILLRRLCEPYGNARWASYTTADMLHKVGKLPVQPTCTAWRQSSGPRKGMENLGSAKPLDRLERHLYRQLQPLGDNHIQDSYWTDGWDYGVLESMLCDYAGLCKGSYYSGRNLDRMMDRMAKVLENVSAKESQGLKQILDARVSAFPFEHLGEHNGWYAIDKKRKKHYSTTGEVIPSSENRSSIKGVTSLMRFLQGT